MNPLDPADLETGAEFCDFCFLPLRDADHLVVELRALCSECLERWHLEYEELPRSKRLNRTIGLCPRGLYAEGRRDPGPNTKLGGRP